MPQGGLHLFFLFFLLIFHVKKLCKRVLKAVCNVRKSSRLAQEQSLHTGMSSRATWMLIANETIALILVSVGLRVLGLILIIGERGGCLFFRLVHSGGRFEDRIYTIYPLLRYTTLAVGAYVYCPILASVDECGFWLRLLGAIFMFLIGAGIAGIACAFGGSFGMRALSNVDTVQFVSLPK